MNRILLFLALMGASQAIHAQYVYTIKADSVKITNNCDTAELIIENHTQDVPGFLYNKGKGRTEFRRGATKLNDSTYLVGADTVKLAMLKANNGASLLNGRVVLGNDQGGTDAALLSSREIPLNNHNILFTGNGKIGIGTNNPRDLIEVASPVAGDSASANLRFTYLNEPDRYSNVIWNKFSGNPPWHYMGFSLTTVGNTITPIILAGDSKIYLNGHVIYSGDIGVNVGSALAPRGTLDLVNTTTTTDANFIVLGNADRFHYHAIKASFHGAWSSENKIQFFLNPDSAATPTSNPLNLLGNNNAIFNGKIGIQQGNPQAYIHVAAGTASAGTAPLKFTAGTVLGTPENGAVEFDGTDLFLTESGDRFKLAKVIDGQLTTNFGGPSLTAFNSITTTLSVAGTRPGDVVNVSANNGASNPPSIIITAYVTSNNTVTLQAYNASNSVVTLASDTYKVRVIR